MIAEKLTQLLGILRTCLDGKRAIATAINSKGVPSYGTESWEQLAINVGLIEGGTSPLGLELIGTYETDLTEYTSTTEERITSNIRANTLDRKYMFFVVTLVCDGTPPTDGKSWNGYLVSVQGRYNTNQSTYEGGGVFYTSARHTYTDLQTDTIAQSTRFTYGVYLVGNTGQFTFARKANAANCPVVMAGHYTMRVYGVTSF